MPELEGWTPRTLPDGLDYLYRPVREGILRVQDLDSKDITMLDLLYIHSFLDNEAWNKSEVQRRIMESNK